MKKKKNESACKPGSVVDSHSSGTCITAGLEQPTRIQCEQHHWIPIWPCSERGLPCRELLPVARCALTAPFHPYRPTHAGVGGLLSVALSVGSRLPGVPWRSALWSPDFPPPGTSTYVIDVCRRIPGSDCPADSARRLSERTALYKHIVPSIPRDSC